MGVKKSTSLLPNPIIGNFRDCGQKIIVIDAMHLIHRMVIGLYNTGKIITNCYGCNVSETYFIFKIAIKFLKNCIIPIFVFDSIRPNNKNNILTRRRKVKQKANKIINDMSGNTPYLENKQPMFKTQQEYDRYIKYIKHSYKINRDNLNLAKFLLKWMGLPIVDAPCEADSQCAAIASMYNDKVIGVLTDDFDPIMHMSINIIKLQNLHSNYFHKYTLNNILLNIENKANSIIRNSTGVE
jgi:flap endonuclease-1